MEGPGNEEFLKSREVIDFPCVEFYLLHPPPMEAVAAIHEHRPFSTPLPYHPSLVTCTRFPLPLPSDREVAERARHFFPPRSPAEYSMETRSRGLEPSAAISESDSIAPSKPRSTFARGSLGMPDLTVTSLHELIVLLDPRRRGAWRWEDVLDTSVSALKMWIAVESENLFRPPYDIRQWIASNEDPPSATSSS